MDFNYKLKDYSIWNALTWGNCRGHFKEASEGTWSNNAMRKFKHGLIGTIECLPIISQIASLFEYMIVTKITTHAPNEEKSASLAGRVNSQSESINQVSGLFSRQSSQPPSSSSALERLNSVELEEETLPSIQFDIEEVLKLKDLSSINLSSVNYEKSLEVEKNSITALISHPHFAPLIDYIQKTKPNKKDVRGIQALYVILGIKPASVIEFGMNEELLNILNNLLPLIGMEGQYQLSKSGNHHYLVNESPLEAFDPRRYLKRLHPSEDTNSLLTAVQYCFPHQNTPQTDQILSYLLGFGPSWETYATSTSYLRSDLPESLFSATHYKEIGSVLRDNLPNILQEPLQGDFKALDVGRAYHQQLPTLGVTKAWNFRRAHIEDQERFTIKGIECCTDGIVVRTNYFKKMHTLTQWVTDTFINT